VLGRPLFVGDTVDVYCNGIFLGERAVVQQSKTEKSRANVKYLKIEATPKLRTAQSSMVLNT